ncbi:MAG TPA: DUF4388 domain-containing protein, partial [Minicystis sp.]|nr:DUF4388 domain-containing protein [Minicystis sp.]
MASSDRSASLVREMLRVEARGLTGTMEVEADGVVTYVYFKGGRAVFAEQGTLGETLGRLLVQTGLLTQEQYARVIARMTQALIDNEQMRLGEVVVELGYLTPDQVHAALADQVRRKIERCLASDEPRWGFDEAPLPDGVGRFPAPIAPCLLDAMRSLVQRARLDALLGPELARYPYVRDAQAVGERFKLTPAELRFIETLDGGDTLGAALASTAARDVDAAAIAASLLVTDELSLGDWRRASLRPAAPAAASPDEAARR